MELRVEDLRKSYGGTAVLQGVSFTAEIGLTRVTGSSGIGKTTLLRILLGLESPDGGATNAGRFRSTLRATCASRSARLTTRRPRAPCSRSWGSAMWEASGCGTGPAA